MAKMFAKNKIIRQVDGVEEVVLARTVFECTPSEAKQLDALGAARQASKAEIEKAAQLEARAQGVEHGAVPGEPFVEPAPASSIENDPKSAPKQK